MTLKTRKNTYSVQMAEYAVQCHIEGDPAFVWWIQHVLAKRNCIIEKVKLEYWVHTHTFGVKIPKSVQEAKSFDRDTSIPFGGHHMQRNEKH